MNSLNLPAYAVLFASLFPILRLLSIVYGPLLIIALLLGFTPVFQHDGLVTARALILRGWLWFKPFLCRLIGKFSVAPSTPYQAPETYSRRRKALWPLDSNTAPVTQSTRFLKSMSRVILVLLGIIFVFASLGGMAAREGIKDAQLEFKRPRIKAVLTFKKDESQTTNEDLRNIQLISRDGGLRLLVQTQFLVVVFVKPDWKSTFKPSFTRPEAFIIPTVNLDAITTQSIE